MSNSQECLDLGEKFTKMVRFRTENPYIYFFSAALFQQNRENTNMKKEKEK